MSDKMCRIVVALVILLFLGGLGLQAEWDRECGPNKRWDPSFWECVDRGG